MTATNSQQKSQKSTVSSSPFKVVPPKTQIQTPPPLSAPETPTNPSKTQPKTSMPVGRWLLIAGLFGGGFWVSQIPMPNAVRADATLEPAPDSYQMIYTEIPGTITEFLIKPGEQVEKNQPIALISTEEMQGEITNAQARFEEVLSEVEASSGQIRTFESKVNEAQVQQAGIARKVAVVQEELNQLSTDMPPPEIQRIQQEIAGLYHQIEGFQSQIKSRKENLSIVQNQLIKFEELMREGGLAQTKVDDLRKEQIMMMGEIGSLNSQVQEIYNQIAAKESEITKFNKQKEEELQQLQDQLAEQQSVIQTASQDLESAQLQIKSRIPLVKTLKGELERQQAKQQTHQVLKSGKPGQVISQDFHKIIGKSLQPGEPVLEIANLNQLVAIIEVRQEDSDMVKAGAEVTFHPLEPGLAAYTTQIEKTDLVMQADLAQQKQLLRVRAVINNSQQKLLPGAKVYAQIESESIPLYEKVRRELMKVFNFRKYGLGG